MTPFPARVFECAPAVASWGANKLPPSSRSAQTTPCIIRRGLVPGGRRKPVGLLGGACSTYLRRRPCRSRLGGNSGSRNYVLANGSGCAPLTGVKATIFFIEDLVWEFHPTPLSTQGFGIQLNAGKQTTIKNWIGFNLWSILLTIKIFGHGSIFGRREGIYNFFGSRRLPSPRGNHAPGGAHSRRLFNSSSPCKTIAREG